jgi:hypothetical protein
LLIGLVWILTLIQTVFDYITMVATAYYYFDFNQDSSRNKGKANLKKGFKFAFLRNFGSLSLASLLKTILVILKLMSEATESIDNRNVEGQN